MQELLKDIVYHADCRLILAQLPDESIDLVITSPPYAERRKATYGGIDEAEYVEWFLPIASEIKRVLKPAGSFFLNIKPHTVGGERSLYVFDLVLAIRRQVGMRLVDEFCWTKNAFPGKLDGRFKNGFEPVYHFAKSNPGQLTFNPLACGTPIKEESVARAYRKQCGRPKNGSGMTGMNTTNIRHLKMSRPSNVIHANNVSNQFSGKQHHPATYPEELVSFFVKSFSNEGDTVLDPFAGSGTTGIVAKKLGRRYILVEQHKPYFDLIQERLKHDHESARRSETLHDHNGNQGRSNAQAVFASEQSPAGRYANGR